MINFSLHVSGSNIRALHAIADGDPLAGGNAMALYALHRAGLVILKPVPSGVEDITVDGAALSDRGQSVYKLIRDDFAQVFRPVTRRRKQES